MTTFPRVSIIIPLHNDEEHVRAALDSCLAQTLPDIEVVCVDDASTDRTADLVEAYAARDPRVRLMRQAVNASAFQARRVGIAAAAAPYILFLDGDDELAPTAAQTTLALASASGADLVGFGVRIATDGTKAPTRFEAALQPRAAEVLAPNILPHILPAGQEANGHLWKYLFSAALLRAAYEGAPQEARFYRANDLPIAFLALSLAKKYVSTRERLYTYHFRRGTSGHDITSLDQFEFILSGIEPITSISDRVHEIAASAEDPRVILDCYESARLHIVANVLRYCVRHATGKLQGDCLTLLKARVSELEVLRAAASFVRGALPALAQQAKPAPLRAAPRSILLTTAHLDTGGLQGVLLSQARALVADGYRVTIAVMRRGKLDVDVPIGATLVVIQGDNGATRVDQWLRICTEHEVDAILDHHILYNEDWPLLAMAASAVGVPTFGWIHNFALRPLFDRSRRESFLAAHLRVLSQVVVLSPTDVAFWKLRGIENVVFLPNPLSDLAETALAVGAPREYTGGRLELVWWGRFDPTTKQVHHLVDVAEHLKTLGIDFRLRIIGPDSPALTADQVSARAVAGEVDDVVALRGVRRGSELLAELDDAHMLVMTSAIEGAPLTIVEAQALGLPLAMYDLPWVTTVRGNAGVATSPPGDALALAHVIAAIAHDPRRFAQMSTAARQFALAVGRIDTHALLVDLIHGRLGPEHSPEPTIEDARLLIEWTMRFADRNLRIGQRGSNETKALRRARDKARKELRDVKSGPSFRIGRIITAVPRKLRALLPTAGGTRSR